MVGIYILAGLCISIGVVFIIIKKRSKLDDKKMEARECSNIDKEINPLINMEESAAYNQDKAELRINENTGQESINKADDENTDFDIKRFIEYMTKYPSTIVKYYNGHPAIDLMGISEEQRFYMWMEKEIIYLLDANNKNNSGLIELPVDEIIYFKKIRDNVTMVNFMYQYKMRYMFLDSEAYRVFTLSIPEKEQKQPGSKITR